MMVSFWAIPIKKAGTAQKDIIRAGNALGKRDTAHSQPAPKTEGINGQINSDKYTGSGIIPSKFHPQARFWKITHSR